MGFRRGGDISSTMSLARYNATYRDRGHRTPRHNCILEIKQDYRYKQKFYAYASIGGTVIFFTELSRKRLASEINTVLKGLNLLF